MKQPFFLVLLLFATYENAYKINISGISAIRFAAGTGIFPHGRDGVLEVQYLNSWLSICNFAFDHVAASTACYMMGYPPYGVPILNSQAKSQYPLGLSNFNCSGRIILGQNRLDHTSVHLGNCQFTSSIPRACLNQVRYVAIACLEPYQIDISNTQPPVTFAPVTCPGHTKEIRLTNGGRASGRVEVKHPETGVWGTVCADGFGTNEARTVCRMLCSSSDDLAYAHTLIGNYQDPPNSSPEMALPIHLARISCAPDAASLNDCLHGVVWGDVRGCTHELDVGVVCGPELVAPKMPIESTLTCDDQETASISFRGDQMHDLTAEMIHLNQSHLPANCVFSVTRVGAPGDDGAGDDERTGGRVVVSFPMDKCGGTYEMSNSTTLAIHLSVVFNRTQPFVLPVTCLIDRSESAQSDVQAVATSILPPIVATRTAPIEITFHLDRLFQRQISDPHNIMPDRMVFTRVSLKRPELNSKLILRSCWLSNSRKDDSTAGNIRIPVIKNGCPIDADVQLLPISRSAIGFSFKGSYFQRASNRIQGGRLLQLFVRCQTRLCSAFETDRECLHNVCS